MGVVRTIQVYQCDICKKESVWTNRWRHKYIHHTYWSDLYTVCSEKCQIELEKKLKRKR